MTFVIKRCVSQLAYYWRKIGTVTVTLKRKMGTLKRKKAQENKGIENRQKFEYNLPRPTSQRSCSILEAIMKQTFEQKNYSSIDPYACHGQ